MAYEVGAAIHVQPNASRVLAKWDFDFEGAHLVTSRSAYFHQGDSLEIFSEEHYEEGTVKEKYGSEFYTAHRVDLHNELKRLATTEDGPGSPAKILLKSEVVGYVRSSGSYTYNMDTNFVPSNQRLGP